MGVRREAKQFRDAEIGGTRAERVGAGQRGQGGPTSGAAAANGQPLAVRLSGFRESLGGGHAILDIDDAPLTAQPLAILAAIAGRAAVVDVDHADAAAGEVCVLEIEQRRRRRRRPAVHEHDEGWQFAGRRLRVRVVWRGYVRMHIAAVRAFEGRRVRARQVVVGRQVISSPPQHHVLAGV